MFHFSLVKSKVLSEAQEIQFFTIIEQDGEKKVKIGKVDQCYASFAWRCALKVRFAPIEILQCKFTRAMCIKMVLRTCWGSQNCRKSPPNFFKNHLMLVSSKYTIPPC